MGIFLKINCEFNDKGAWCINKKVKRSLFGLGARVCCEYSDTPKDCKYKKQFKKGGYGKL